jgi:ketosteroid isomerase-like protein
VRGHGGVELEVVEGWATWIRDGKITRIEQYASKAEALEAAGLRE